MQCNLYSLRDVEVKSYGTEYGIVFVECSFNSSFEMLSIFNLIINVSIAYKLIALKSLVVLRA